MLYRAWAEGWGPKFYKVGVTRRITYRARLEWQRERETAAERQCRGSEMTSGTKPPKGSASRSILVTNSSGTRGRPVSKLYTMEEVAEILGLSKRSVQRLVATGALRVHRLGRAVRVSDSDIAILLADTHSF